MLAFGLGSAVTRNPGNYVLEQVHRSFWISRDPTSIVSRMAAADGIPMNIELLPLESPPNGTLPSFENPEDRSYELFIVAGFCLCLIVAFTCLRVYAKVYLLRTHSKDDWPVFGRHAWDVLIKDLSVGKIQVGKPRPPEKTRERTKINQLSLTIATIYGPSIWMIKLSLFLLFLEIFGTLRWLRLLVYLGIVVNGIIYLAITIAMAASCAPKHGYTKLDYLSAITADKCARNDYLNTWPGLFNILSDFYLLILPLPAVWGLQLPTRKKLGICGMFLTGFMACICSILSLAYRLILRDNPHDSNWYFIPRSIVSIAEVTAGVIIPSVPSLSVVCRHYQPTVIGYSTGWGQKLKSVLSSRTTEIQKTADSLEMGTRSDSYRKLNV
ncbi:MAG: hypothetical protein Q9215_000202 [Flavoplaca cf. flavocitrina]